MNRFGQAIAMAVALAFFAAPSWAQERQRSQRPGFDADGASALNVLSAKDVQKELKMTDDQIAKVTTISTKQREAMRDIRTLEREEQLQKRRQMNQEGEKAATDILNPEQAKRFAQIRLQQKQTRAFTDEATAKALNFTDEQTKKVKEIQDEARAKRQEIVGNRGANDAGGDSRQKLMDFNKSVDEKMLTVLTTEQKGKWKEMLGEPFKGEIPRPAPARSAARAANAAIRKTRKHHV